MRRRPNPYLFELALLTGLLAGPLSGCAGKATAEDCGKACSNVARIAHSAVEKKVEQNQDLAAAGKDFNGLAQSMAEVMMEQITSTCQEQCLRKGTRQVAQCMADARSQDELKRCQ
jgi:hypothetical protein